MHRDGVPSGQANCADGVYGIAAGGTFGKAPPSIFESKILIESVCQCQIAVLELLLGTGQRLAHQATGQSRISVRYAFAANRSSSPRSG